MITIIQGTHLPALHPRFWLFWECSHKVMYYLQGPYVTPWSRFYLHFQGVFLQIFDIVYKIRLVFFGSGNLLASICF